MFVAERTGVRVQLMYQKMRDCFLREKKIFRKEIFKA
jgi:hypothetical protein